MQSVLRDVVLAGVVLGLTGCGDDSNGAGGGTPSATAASSGGAGGAAPVGWIGGSCGRCFGEKCASQIAACDADPGCASTYACLAACAADPPDGSAQEACAAACVPPDSSTALAAYQSLDTCRTSGDGFNGCPSCQPEVEQPQCEPAVPPSNCTVCLERECCEWIGKYRLNAEAGALSDCAGGCPDEGFEECFLECAEQHPDGLADWGSTFGCLAIHCLGEENCGNPGDPVDPCARCIADECADLSFACDSQPDCLLHSYCFGACDGDVECSRACNDAYPAAVGPFNDLSACILSRCEDVCGD